MLRHDRLFGSQFARYTIKEAFIDTVSSRTALPKLERGTIEMSGNFDSKKASLYSGELSYRINPCRQLTLFMEHFLITMTPIPSTSSGMSRKASPIVLDG